MVLTVEKQADGSAAILAGSPKPNAEGTSTRVLTPPLQTDGRWHHFWTYVDAPRAVLNGMVTAALRLRDQTGGDVLAVYLDEVSLGSTPGGPWGIYLPFVVR